MPAPVATVYPPAPEADLIEFIKTSSGDILGRSQLTTTQHRELRLLIGPCLQVMKYAQAYLLLVNSNFTREAEPLARAAFEHAVTAQWTYLTVDGFDRFLVWASRTEKEHWSQLAKWSNNTEMADFADKLVIPAGKSMPNYGNILHDGLIDGEFFQLTQSVLSQTLHITPSSIANHLDPTDASKLIQFPKPLFGYETTLVVAMSCMLTAGLVADLIYDQALSDGLDAASDELKLPRDISAHIPPARSRILPDWPESQAS